MSVPKSVTRQGDAFVIDKLRAECRSSGSQANWARIYGFSPSFVGDVLHGRRALTAKLAAALGYERIVYHCYVGRARAEAKLATDLTPKGTATNAIHD